MTVSTNPSDWFLSYDPAVNSGNLVTPLIDGASYFSHLDVLLPTLGNDDLFCVAGWQLDVEIELLGPGNGSVFWDHIDAALQNDVSVRFLVYPGMPTVINPSNYLSGDEANYYYNRAQRHQHQQLFETVRDLSATYPEVEMIIDRHYPYFGSHHAKYSVAGIKDTTTQTYQLFGFCGGIDVATSRWAEPGHMPVGFFHPFPNQFPEGTSIYPWHDIQAKVEGPLVKQMLEHFANRWNATPSEAAYSATKTTPIDVNSLSINSAAVGTHYVELLHTYACAPANVADGRTTQEYEDDAYYEFVPRGMNTIEEAYIKAIDMAEHYIYLENFAFESERISQALYDKLDNNAQVQVFFLTNYKMGGNSYYSQPLFDQVRSAANGHNFYIFDARIPGMGYQSVHGSYPDEGYKYGHIPYIHSKIMIVDDTWATIGSANLNNRSMTMDTEMNIAFMDATLVTDAELSRSVCEVVRNFRIELWTEWLQLSPGQQNLIENIPQALQTWHDRTQTVPAQVPAPTPSLIHEHDLSLRKSVWPAPAYQAVWSTSIDPDMAHPD